MGRTNPTYRDTLSHLQEEWSDFRRGLRYHDQEHWDNLWKQAADYADAAGYHYTTRKMDLVLMSMLLAQERRIAELEEQLDEEENGA